MGAAEVRKQLRRLHYRIGWDGRCRNEIPAHEVRRLLRDFSGNGLVLDVGSSDFGLSEFLPEIGVVGLDRTFLEPRIPFVAGSIMELPFCDGAFPIVTSIDVLEHLPGSLRPAAIEELVRVTRRALIVAFPQHPLAARSDRTFRLSLERRRLPIPEWLAEHEEYGCPDPRAIREQLLAAGRRRSGQATIDALYAEPVRLTNLARRLWTKAPGLYTLSSPLFGLLSTVLPRPTSERAYRVVFVLGLS